MTAHAEYTGNVKAYSLNDPQPCRPAWAHWTGEPEEYFLADDRRYAGEEQLEDHHVEDLHLSARYNNLYVNRSAYPKPAEAAFVALVPSREEFSV